MKRRGGIPAVFAIPVLALLLSLSLSGCSAGREAPKPVPVMDFAHMAPYPVRVAAVQVEDKYVPSANPADVSSGFAVPPDIAARQYAENRLKAAGGSGDALHFVIEDARVIHSVEHQDEGRVAEWMGTNLSDLYEVTLRVRLYTAAVDGRQSAHSILTLSRTISIPQHFTLGEKEYEQSQFVASLIQDLDRAVTAALSEKMGLAGR